ncbi:hypothetical protein DB30_05174 [Enhygromyxa salina]|uniref:Uncharacterized protein n=1 Tax=Enhygromyxa salina TaxID=215803 RepID=A0A0C2D759_9BACT|nr:hypothetical protein [Enhygromyxa salina]KIG15867.1 hypothetical protein DB30_05174 [Enhygromyxa salina]
MLEIARLLENALANNRSGLRKAAKQTLAKAPLITTIRELLASEAGDAMRELTLSDLEDALIAAGAGAKRGTSGESSVASPASNGGRQADVDTKPATSADSQSREEFMYRRILEVLTDTPSLTIGQLAKRIEVDTIELRGYLSWMRRVGKVSSIGRARATRYSLPDGVVAAG